MVSDTIKLGDTVWVAIPRGQYKRITCPDCFGTGQLDVILKDGTRHSIDCSACTHGYHGPLGYIDTHDYEPKVSAETITGIEQHIGQPTEFRAGSYVYKADQIYLTEADALARAAEMAQDQASEEALRIKRKEKDTRSWSWNSHYHRKCIRDAEKAIQYHTAKLNVASIKAKEDRAAAKESEITRN